MAEQRGMCRQCGRVLVLKGYLIPYHDEHPPFRAVCPGSKKQPRDDGDTSPLWSGKPAPANAGGGE
jgi:hypothetical protein